MGRDLCYAGVVRPGCGFGVRRRGGVDGRGPGIVAAVAAPVLPVPAELGRPRAGLAFERAQSPSVVAMTTQTWIITGASRGFGRALAESALEAGENMVAAVRRPDSVADLRATH